MPLRVLAVVGFPMATHDSRSCIMVAPGMMYIHIATPDFFYDFSFSLRAQCAHGIYT